MRVALAIGGLFCALSAFAANEKTCTEIRKKYDRIYEWDLDKVRKAFGPPARIDRSFYQGQDVLGFDFSGCFFFLYLNKSGRASPSPDGFHYKPSELLGKSGPRELTQPTQIDAVFASIQTLESRVKQLEDSVAKLTSIVAGAHARNRPKTVSSKPVRGTPPAGSIDYAGVGSGHWIEDVSSNGRVIELEDGSLWEIEATGQIDTALWLPTTEISVQQESSSIGEYKYVLVNKDDGEKVSAKFLGMG